MRISVPQDEINSVMSIALRAISSRSILPVLSGVKLSIEGETLYLSATDLEITLHCSVPVSVEQKGQAVLPAKLLGEAIKNLPPEPITLEMDHDEGQAILECGKARYTIKGLPLEDYPQLPDASLEESLRLSGDAVSEAIRQVIKAVGRDEARPTLSGVLFSISGESMKIVATDSYRLAVKELAIVEAKEDVNVIVPSRAVEELGKLTGEEEIRFSAGENQISFKAGDVTLVSRLIEGQFPKYEQLIPEERETRLSFNKDNLIEAIKRVSVVAPSNAIVRMVVSDSSIVVSAHATDIGHAQDEVECSVVGEGLEIAFSAQYLLDGLAALQGNSATMDLISPLKPAVIRSEGKEDYLYLIMPIRLS
ncbi:MAG: DNA polymerase III subunit beta [Candidatus Aquicultorales bacterium]